MIAAGGLAGSCCGVKLKVCARPAQRMGVMPGALQTAAAGGDASCACRWEPWHWGCHMCGRQDLSPLLVEPSGFMASENASLFPLATTRIQQSFGGSAWMVATCLFRERDPQSGSRVV